MSHHIKRKRRPQDRQLGIAAVMGCPTGEQVVALPDPDDAEVVVAQVQQQATLDFCLSRGWQLVHSAPEAEVASVADFTGLSVADLEDALEAGKADHCLDQLLAHEQARSRPRVTAVRAIQARQERTR